MQLTLLRIDEHRHLITAGHGGDGRDERARVNEDGLVQDRGQVFALQNVVALDKGDMSVSAEALGFRLKDLINCILAVFVALRENESIQAVLVSEDLRQFFADLGGML